MSPGAGVIGRYRHEAIYLMEIQSQCGHGLWNLQRLRESSVRWLAAEAAMETGTGASRFHDMMNAANEVFDSVQGFLTSWARVSLLLKQSSGGDRERAGYLRDLLGMSEDHPIFDRTLRNDWMHFDQRLDDAIKVYDQVSVQRFCRSTNPPAGVVMRTIYVDTLEVEFIDRRFSLEEMGATVTEVHEKAADAEKTAGKRWREEFLKPSPLEY